MEQQMLKDKVAIITGSSYGMGQTMAELFAEEGASVVLTARHEDGQKNDDKLKEVVDGIRGKGGKAIGVMADVCSTEDTKKVFDSALKEFGDVDILINNAGIGEQKMIDETDDDWMKMVINTNLCGPMRYIREALKIFLPKNDGCIINISSVNGTRPFCGASYTSTKGAVNTLTKNVAMRLIDTNIRCNAVAPGSTITPAHIANKAGKQPGGAKMLGYSGHYVYFPGPECDPIDQAYACLYLASKMGRHVKGQVIQVCNGAFL
jgi:3-oxoacyl-[acyl-carrier protein] reductase